MESETWMNAKKAKELGFCDEVLYEENENIGQQTLPSSEDKENHAGLLYSSRMMDMAILNRLCPPDTSPPEMEDKNKGALPYQLLRDQLEFLR